MTRSPESGRLDWTAVALAHVTDAVIVIDANETVLSVNRSAERLYACSESSIVGQPLSELYQYGWVRPEDEFDAHRALQTVGFWHGENIHIRRDGTALRVESSVSALHDASGVVTAMVAVIRDVTDRKITQDALHETQERLSAVIDSVKDYAVFTLDTEGRVTTWNEGARRLTGYTTEEIVGQHMSRFYLPSDLVERKPEREMHTAQTTGQSEDESLRVRKDGSVRWVNEIMTPLTRDGTLVGYTKVSRDLTERRRAEDELRKSEERLRLVLDTVTDFAIITLDAKGYIRTWHAGAERMFGYTEAEAVGAHTRIIFTPEDRVNGVAEAEMRAAAETGSAIDERWHVNTRGDRVYVSGTLAALWERGLLTGFVKIARDLTERKGLEDALTRAHEELEERVRVRTRQLEAEVAERLTAERNLQNVMRRLVTVQEEERQRVARELHDDLGQRMTAIHLQMEVLKTRGVGTEHWMQRFAETQRYLLQLDRDLRHFTGELRAAALYNLGLGPALSDLATEFTTNLGKTVIFNTLGTMDGRLTAEIEINLYRIAQEAVTNAHKHSQASEIEILLQRRDDRVVLSVIDNGQGFEQDGVAHAPCSQLGMGLVSMRQRAALIGGALEIESGPHGTSVIVCAPIRLRDSA